MYQIKYNAILKDLWVFFASECSVSTYVYRALACLIPDEFKKGVGFSGISVLGQLWATMQVLEQFLCKNTSPLHPQMISTIPDNDIFKDSVCYK